MLSAAAGEVTRRRASPAAAHTACLLYTSSGAKLYNNHAALAGDDIYLAGKNSTLTLTKVGDDWMLDDCGHKINGWFADLLDARWDADGKQEHVINLKDYAADGLTIVENEDGSYTITILKMCIRDRYRTAPFRAFGSFLQEEAGTT